MIIKRKVLGSWFIAYQRHVSHHSAFVLLPVPRTCHFLLNLVLWCQFQFFPGVRFVTSSHHHHHHHHHHPRRVPEPAQSSYLYNKFQSLLSPDFLVSCFIFPGDAQNSLIVIIIKLLVEQSEHRTNWIPYSDDTFKNYLSTNSPSPHRCMKSTTSLPMSPQRTVYVVPKPAKGAQKRIR